MRLGDEKEQGGGKGQEEQRSNGPWLLIRWMSADLRKSCCISHTKGRPKGNQCPFAAM